MKPKILFRADGNSTIGLGHIFRALALAEIAKGYFECIFYTKYADTEINRQLSEVGAVKFWNGYDLDEPLCEIFIQNIIGKNDIVVLDGYGFDLNFQTAIKDLFGCKLLSIDDDFKFSFVSDIVINPSGRVGELKYKASPQTKLLLGPEYAILRQPFYSCAKGESNIKTIRQIFVCFGGADPDNYTLETIRSLRAGIDISVRVLVVIGSSYMYKDKLKSYLKNSDNVELFESLTANELLDVMKVCDTAICSASTIAYEYCSVSGLLFVIKTAENQNNIYNFLVYESLALPFDLFFDTVRKDEICPMRNMQMERQNKLFDGKAAKRLLKALFELYLRNNLFLRRATFTDIDIYFHWANDDDVRRNSFNMDSISYEDHRKWFTTNTQNKASIFYICTSIEGKPIASIRFTISGGKAVLSYLVDCCFRNAGLGTTLLKKAASKLFCEMKEVYYIEGKVKESNIASIKSFISAGYAELHSNEVGIKVFVLNR